MHKTLNTLAVAGALAFPGLALADLSANLGLTTNYKYRGQDQSANKPAVSAGFDWSSGGLYLGNWNSSIGFTDAGLEMDIYGGYKTEVGGVGLDIGFLRYQYPQKVSVGDINTTELYVGASYGMFGAKYSRTISSKYFGIADGKGTGYIALTGDVPLGDKLVLNAAYGTTRFSGGAKKVGAVNYDDFKLGVTADLGSGFKASVAYVGATEKDAWGDINKARVIVSLTKSM